MNFEKKIGQNVNKIVVHKVVFHLLPCISFKKKGDMFETGDKLRCLCLETGDKLRCLCVCAERGIWNNGRNRKL